MQKDLCLIVELKKVICFFWPVNWVFLCLKCFENLISSNVIFLWNLFASKWVAYYIFWICLIYIKDEISTEQFFNILVLSLDSLIYLLFSLILVFRKSFAILFSISFILHKKSIFLPLLNSRQCYIH